MSTTTPSEPEQLRKLFIGGLHYKTTTEGMKEYFEQYGEILDCIVMINNETGKSRGFGFITYASSDCVDSCQAARPHTIDGKVVEPKRAVPREESSQDARQSVKKLFVGGVKDDHTEEQLREYFSQYGTVEEVDVIKDKETDKPRGFAFVAFDDYDPVDKCVLHKSHEIGGKKCDVKKAMPKGQSLDQRGGYGGGHGRGGGGGHYGYGYGFDGYNGGGGGYGYGGGDGYGYDGGFGGGYGGGYAGGPMRGNRGSSRGGPAPYYGGYGGRGRGGVGGGLQGQWF